MFISEQFISIFLGIIAGIVTAIIIWITNQFFKKVILPWFQEIVYKGVNVSGHWNHSQEINVSSDNKRLFELSFELQQNAHEVTGTFRAKNNFTKDSKEYTNYYKIKGLVKDNYLLFTYTALRKERTGVGSFLLRIANGGTQLIGSAIFTPDADPDDSNVTERTGMVFVRN